MRRTWPLERILVALAGCTLSAFVVCHTDLFDVRTRGVVRLMGLVTLVTTVAGAGSPAGTRARRP